MDQDRSPSRPGVTGSGRHLGAQAAVPVPAPAAGGCYAAAADSALRTVPGRPLTVLSPRLSTTGATCQHAGGRPVPGAEDAHSWNTCAQRELPFLRQRRALTNDHRIPCRGAGGRSGRRRLARGAGRRAQGRAGGARGHAVPGATRRPLSANPAGRQAFAGESPTPSVRGDQCRPAVTASVTGLRPVSARLERADGAHARGHLTPPPAPLQQHQQNQLRAPFHRPQRRAL